MLTVILQAIAVWLLVLAIVVALMFYGRPGERARARRQERARPSQPAREADRLVACRDSPARRRKRPKLTR
jgi:hypothetical protein